MNRAWLLVAVLAAAVVCGGGCGRTRMRGPAIGLWPAEGVPKRVVVKGLEARELEAFGGLSEEKKQAVLRVWVADAPQGAPPLLGEVTREDQDLAFVPRYPFSEGLSYLARFDRSALGGDSIMEMRFTLAAPAREPVVRVTGIYPSADELPENLLKFYIHFSAPMSRGEAYSRVKLLDGSGKVVAWPFLEMAEELWNGEMTRFTLFFEPGRIKQGLVPREELGAALESGKKYTLVVDGAWKDDQGRALVEGTRKTFRATGADRKQPDPARWRIVAPKAGSEDALVVGFDEPLDHGMLQRVMVVKDGSGSAVEGKVEIGEEEKRWALRPAEVWKKGRYVLVVETILEDVAGNSVGRAFEVRLGQGSTGEAPVPQKDGVVEVAFEVK